MTWSPGDQAMCIRSGPWYNEAGVEVPGPGFMTVHTVTDVVWGRWPHEDGSFEEFLSLRFAEYPHPGDDFEAAEFSKLDPLEEEDPIFVEETNHVRS